MALTWTSSLSARTAYTIGRGSQATVSLPDTVLSRQHAEIRREGDKFWLRDLDSTNGTQLNQRSVGKAVALKHDDVVKLGDQELQVLFPGDGEVAPPEPNQTGEKFYVAMNSLRAKTTLKQAFSMQPGWSDADKGQFEKKTAPVNDAGSSVKPSK